MQVSPGEDKIPVVGSASSPQSSREGLYFSDGRRKVDYVLVFHQRRPSSIRSLASASISHDRLSIVSNGNFPSVGTDAAVGRGGVVAGGQPASVGEVFMELGGPAGNEPADHEIHLIRQEFEANLLEAGLELERDRELKSPSFTRLHAPWPVLCREAEFLKIKVPTKTSYELKEESGFGSSVSSFWRKLNHPFQPKVHQEHGRTKFLSHCFSRDKLHQYNIKCKDTFFDNATRARIVYEILRRTVCVRTCQTIGISTLIAKGVYDSAFPLHDGDYKVIGHLEERSDRRVHTGEKPYSCDQCGKAFTTLGGVNVHRRIHTGEKPYSCDECEKAFNTPTELKLHRRTHTGEKPFNCDQCGKMFSQSSNLQTHRRVHTGEKPFWCDQCEKTFNSSCHLQRHRRVHTGEKLSCEQCGKSFTRGYNLKVHQRSHAASL